jgi:hypothetical protein
MSIEVMAELTSEQKAIMTKKGVEIYSAIRDKQLLDKAKEQIVQNK